ncbi:caspase family protein [Bradyrhizobium sp. CW9]|nr:caspase family protein [Bradyrhizobium sp. CW9]
MVAGIDRYPQMAKEPTLPPAGKDIENLIDLFANFLAYDVVIVSKNEAVEPTQFVRLFSEYLPSILQNRFGSQVVFAYSGHGGFWANESYILTQRAERLIIDSQKSADDAISMTDLRSMLRPTIIASHQFLALLNSCEGGAFLRDRLRFGQPSSRTKPPSQPQLAASKTSCTRDLRGWGACSSRPSSPFCERTSRRSGCQRAGKISHPKEIHQISLRRRQMG